MKHIVIIFSTLLLLFSCKESEPDNITFATTQLNMDEYIRKYVTDSCLVIGHASDIHAYWENWEQNLYCFFNLFSQDNLKKQVDALLLTGDYCAGTCDRDKSMAIDEIKSVFNIVLSQDIPTYAIIGNHDDNIDMGRGRISYNGQNHISKREQADLIINPLLQKWNSSEIGDAGYYKIDFLQEKVRMICLDFIDYPYELNPEGAMRHEIGFFFSQQQLEWLYQTLLATPSNYGVCIVIHGIPTSEYQIGEYAQGINLIPDIIEAYRKGTSFKHTWSHPVLPEYSTHVEFDFTSRGAGDFICYLGGHIHVRKVTRIAKYPNQIMITAPSLFTSADNELFNIISINTHLRELSVFCYDNGMGGVSNGVIKIKY